MDSLTFWCKCSDISSITHISRLREATTESRVESNKIHFSSWFGIFLSLLDIFLPCCVTLISCRGILRLPYGMFLSANGIFLSYRVRIISQYCIALVRSQCGLAFVVRSDCWCAICMPSTEKLLLSLSSLKKYKVQARFEYRVSHAPISISAPEWICTAALAVLWRWSQLTQNGWYEMSRN
jgi:hypothetical protein